MELLNIYIYEIVADACQTDFWKRYLDCLSPSVTTFKDHTGNHEHLTGLRNKPQKKRTAECWQYWIVEVKTTTCDLK